MRRELLINSHPSLFLIDLFTPESVKQRFKFSEILRLWLVNMFVPETLSMINSLAFQIWYLFAQTAFVIFMICNMDEKKHLYVIPGLSVLSFDLLNDIFCEIDVSKIGPSVSAQKRWLKIITFFFCRFYITLAKFNIYKKKC